MQLRILNYPNRVDENPTRGPQRIRGTFTIRCSILPRKNIGTLLNETNHLCRESLSWISTVSARACTWAEIYARSETHRQSTLDCPYKSGQPRSTSQRCICVCLSGFVMLLMPSSNRQLFAIVCFHVQIVHPDVNVKCS